MQQSTIYNKLMLHFLYAVLLTLHCEAVLIISTEVCVFERLFFGLGILPLFSELDAICDSDF